MIDFAIHAPPESGELQRNQRRRKLIQRERSHSTGASHSDHFPSKEKLESLLR